MHFSRHHLPCFFDTCFVCSKASSQFSKYVCRRLQKGHISYLHPAAKRISSSSSHGKREYNSQKRRHFICFVFVVYLSVCQKQMSRNTLIHPWGCWWGRVILTLNAWLRIGNWISYWKFRILLKEREGEWKRQRVNIY